MMTDPIADMLTRIRNAVRARHDRCDIPASRLKAAVAKVLKEEGFIADVRPSEGEGPKQITLVLKYGRDRSSAIDGIRRVSRPGRRVYVGHDAIPKPRAGLGLAIVSTSRGVMSDRDARRLRLGGELVCEVW